MVTNVKDINDIFDDILLTEDNITRKGYQDGYEEGITEGNLEGYQLGYVKGAELGIELGTVYGTIVAHLQKSKSPKVLKTLEQLKFSIENFPRTNDPNADILEQIESIRFQYKKIKAILHINAEEKDVDKKDLTF